MDLKLAIQLYKNMGARYVAYRAKHELEKKLGLLKRKHPNVLRMQYQIGISEWKSLANGGACIQKELLRIDRNDSEFLKTKAEQILEGQLPFFNAEWIALGKNYNWVTNPFNGYVYDVSKHWSEIPDLSEQAGDIKYVWEKSRFSWILTLIRYDYHFNKDISEFVFSEIESWIECNPINRGPNWRCSQEISLRIFHWYFALTYYRDSPALTE